MQIASKCQNLLSWINIENISICCLLKILPRVLKCRLHKRFYMAFVDPEKAFDQRVLKRLSKYYLKPLKVTHPLISEYFKLKILL